MFCIVVKRGSFQSYDLLHRAFGQKVPVVWDRRRCERRQNDQSADVVSRRVQFALASPSATVANMLGGIAR